ncbi:16032_t:CDS:2, partial [Racocetra fulgida]
NDPQALNEKLKNYITSREFWANIECLHKVLEPVKTAVKTVESLKLQGEGENSARELVAQIHNYDLQKPPYDSLFQDHLELPETWWKACKQPYHHLQKLALLFLAITPHNAGCECVFLILNWFTQKRTIMFEEDIQSDSEDDSEINLEDSVTNDLSKVNSNTLNIENSVNLEYTLINTDQPIILDEAIDHDKKDFDIDALTNQVMQM